MSKTYFVGNSFARCSNQVFNLGLSRADVRIVTHHEQLTGVSIYPNDRVVVVPPCHLELLDSVRQCHRPVPNSFRIHQQKDGPMTAYNHEYTRRVCASLNMPVDEVALTNADTRFEATNASQFTFDVAMTMHAELVNRYFTAKNYTFLNRVKMAFYFLTGIGR